MIALLIGSVALGMAAPMITKQIKQNNFADTQFRVINRNLESLEQNTNSQIDDILSQLEETTARLAELENTESDIPAGAVMYFDLIKCPDGWAALTSKYPNAANAFIRNQSGSGRTLGSWQQNAAPNVEGSFYALDQINSYTGAFYRAGSRTGGWGGAGQYVYRQQYLDMSMYSSVYKDDVTEIRPDNIVLLACRKK